MPTQNSHRKEMCLRLFFFLFRLFRKFKALAKALLIIPAILPKKKNVNGVEFRVVVSLARAFPGYGVVRRDAKIEAPGMYFLAG